MVAERERREVRRAGGAALLGRSSSGHREQPGREGGREQRRRETAPSHRASIPPETGRPGSRHGCRAGRSRSIVVVVVSAPPICARISPPGRLEEWTFAYVAGPPVMARTKSSKSSAAIPRATASRCPRSGDVRGHDRAGDRRRAGRTQCVPVCPLPRFLRRNTTIVSVVRRVLRSGCGPVAPPSRCPGSSAGSGSRVSLTSIDARNCPAPASPKQGPPRSWSAFSRMLPPSCATASDAESNRERAGTMASASVTLTRKR